MIKYDYKIIRDEGDEEITYIPKLRTELPALAYIEGPNSSGKSTLLNLIGVAFNGNKRKDINETLKARMDSLVNSEHQKVEFNIVIDEHGSVLTLEKKLESKKIEVRVDGKILSPEKVDEKYNLIYDIPEDPLNRIGQLINSIKFNQEQMSLKLNSVRSYLQTQLNEVKNSKKIQEHKLKISEMEEKIEILEENINEQKYSYNIVKSYFYIHWCLEYTAKLKDVEKKLCELEIYSKSAERRLNNEVTRLQKRLKGNIMNCEKYKQNIDESIGVFFSNQDQIIRAWNEINFHEVMNVKKIPKRYFTTISAIMDRLEIVVSSVNQTRRKNYEMWQQIIRILENADDTQIKVPGIEKKLNEFVDSLKRETVGLKNDIDKVTRAEDLQKQFIKLEESTKELSKHILPELLKAIDESPDNGQLGSIFDDGVLEEDKMQLSKKIEKYRTACVANGIDVDNELVKAKIKSDFLAFDSKGNYIRFNESQAENAIADLERDLESNIDKRNRIINMKNSFLDELKIMKNAKEHKYSSRDLDIEKLINIIQNLKQKMDLYNQQIDKLSNGFFDLKYQDGYYYTSVFKYLGHKIGAVHHIDGIYNIKYVDLINKEMITIGGKKIKFTDMGTGQSQSAYLIGKLNTIDNRKVIALIDEVAMMDNKSLEPIYTKLRELYNNNKLIIAIVVQKSDEMKVKEF